MNTSADFRSSHTILASVPILRGVEAKHQASLLEPAVSTGPSDVLDVNLNGKADPVKSAKSPFQDSTQRKPFKLQEPVFVSPPLSKVASWAATQQMDVVTEKDARREFLIADRSVEQDDDDPRITHVVDTNVRRAIRLTDDLLPSFHPEAQLAVDFSTHELLIYEPRGNDGLLVFEPQVKKS